MFCYYKLILLVMHEEIGKVLNKAENHLTQ